MLPVTVGPLLEMPFAASDGGYWGESGHGGFARSHGDPQDSVGGFGIVRQTKSLIPL